MMLIKFKRVNNDVKLPTQRIGDIGFDVYASEDVVLQSNSVTKVKTGLIIADFDPDLQVVSGATSNFITHDVNVVCDHLTVYPKIEGRSSLATKGIFPVGNIIDPIYRGEICVTLANLSPENYDIKAGDKIAQFVFYTTMTLPNIEIEETDAVVQTTRGTAGFGSTGR